MLRHQLPRRVLAGRHAQKPKAEEVRKYYELCWTAWAGQPEEAVIVDRARSFLGDFADYLEEEGVRLESAALASAWHIGKVERHDGVWSSMFVRVVHDRQLSGLQDVRTAVTECNRAKNTLARQSGFFALPLGLGQRRSIAG